jgi:hypothetical protein
MRGFLAAGALSLLVALFAVKASVVFGHTTAVWPVTIALELVWVAIIVWSVRTFGKKALWFLVGAPFALVPPWLTLFVRTCFPDCS